MLIFRDITQRRRTEQRQATQLAVTRILAESVDVAAAVPQLLAAIGENTGWEVGHMWSVDPDGGRLRRQKSWSASTVSAEAFAAASRGATLLPGDSLPSRVWRTGRPDWTTNVGTDADFDRSKAPNPSECGRPTLFRFRTPAPLSP